MAFPAFWVHVWAKYVWNPIFNSVYATDIDNFNPKYTTDIDTVMQKYFLPQTKYLSLPHP